jgi:hypothetical protein
MQLRFARHNTTNGTATTGGRMNNRLYRPTMRGRYTDYATWADAQSHNTVSAEQERKLNRRGTFPGLGTNKILASWLWSAEDVSLPGVEQALRGAFDAETQLLNDATMGVGTQKPPFMRGGGNAVNPAFRTAIMRPAAELQWDGFDQRKLAERKVAALKFGASLKSLNPTGGTYANEADPNFPDWQHAFWGSNYERLFSIKQRVDPYGVFYCRSCVGSELYEDRSGMLCRL